MPKRSESQRSRICAGTLSDLSSDINVESLCPQRSDPFQNSDPPNRGQHLSVWIYQSNPYRSTEHDHYRAWSVACRSVARNQQSADDLLDSLTENQIRAYILADNKLAEKAGWDESILAIEFQHLLTVDLGFEVSVTGFEMPEIDLILTCCQGRSKSGPVWRSKREPFAGVKGV